MERDSAVSMSKKKKHARGKRQVAPQPQRTNQPTGSSQQPVPAWHSEDSIQSEPHPQPEKHSTGGTTTGPAPETEKKRGTFKRLTLWTFWTLLCWWAVSAVIPGLPTPLHAGKELLFIMKDVGDAVYFTANESNLEESARKVRDASKVLDSSAITEQTQEISADRLKRMPVVSQSDDSVARSSIATVSTAPVVRGRVFNVLVMGIDSRIGVRDARADAIHLFTINPDSGIVEIMSIPRDTYCDLGYPDTTTFNIVANARAAGYNGFLNHIERLTHRGSIEYYIEVGFSQALGVLEILGYEDPHKTLQFLRTRKTLAMGDIQRSHNQARFMADNLKSKFNLLTGSTGDLFLMAGLQFVTTNLTKETCQGLIYNLQKVGFPNHRPDAVRLRLLSASKIRLKEMIADKATIESTLSRNKRVLGSDSIGIADVATRLRKINRLALADSNRPVQVVNRLSRIHQQRGWIQIRDVRARKGIRDTLSLALERAYQKLGKTQEAQNVRHAREAEDFLLNQYK